MTPLTRAPAGLSLGGVIAVGDAHSQDRSALVTALAALIAEATAVEISAVDHPRAALAMAATLRDPLLCVAVGRHGLASLRDLPFPMLVVGPRCDLRAARPPLVGDIVVCLDGSTRAQAALADARGWATTLGLDLSLVSVVSAHDAAVLARHGGSNDLLESGYLARAATSAAPAGAAVSWEVLHGEAASALVAHARSSRASLLALNTHGASTSAEDGFGRVPARLVMHSPVPVLLTRCTEAPRLARVPSAAPAYRVHSRPAPSAREPSARRPRSRRGSGTIVRRLIALGLLSFVAAVVPLPYYSVRGSTLRAAQMVTVEGVRGTDRAGRSARSLLVPIVDLRPVTTATMVTSWLDPNADIEMRAANHLPSRAERDQSRELMANAGHTATRVGLAYVGRDASTAHVQFHARGLGGSSAGLAFALEIIDVLSPNDLTGGHRVAVTGTLDVDGNVGTVGGITYKVDAARRAGAEVMLVPSDNYRDAVAASRGMRVVAVATLEDALSALRSLPRR